ncbi:MAG: heparinase II/III family protein [Balneolales bacterium]
MIRKINLLYNTLRYLKIQQIIYRLYYLTRNKSNLKKNDYKVTRLHAGLKPIQLKPYIAKPQTYTQPGTFCFINLVQAFKGAIDWNHAGHGKLWTYNLNYFDFLNQNSISREEGLRLIFNFIGSESILADGKEAYPTSLRLINWLKFIYRHNIRNQGINDFMLSDLHNLTRNVEFHLMANHLLENAMALTIGGYCLNQQDIYEKGMNLLVKELDEQMCDDGGHYERSPMYHQILLDRLLDAINFLGERDSHLLRKSAIAMLSWLESITFSDGSIPYFNDSSSGIAPSTAQLKKYAYTLGVNTEKINYGNSGYRKMSSDNYELIADGGNIGPAYQPAHGHNDAGSFILHVNKLPFIIDTGASTYEINDRRAHERSVTSHNTTHPDGIEPSELWSSFRVARRETVKITKETRDSLEITRVLPYKERQTLIRSFHCYDDFIRIFDQSQNGGNYKAYIHFAPHVEIKKTNYGISTSEADLFVNNVRDFGLEDCKIACGFNLLQDSKKLVMNYSGKMDTLIKIKAGKQ